MVSAETAPGLATFSSRAISRTIARRMGHSKRTSITPSARTVTLLPGVLLIHGGGWAVGSKAMHHGFGRLLATHGFLAAAVDYRLTGTAPWPACLDDCRTALAWLRQSAKELRLDPTRLALLGDSAGAHLAALLGLEAARMSWPVRGVVGYFGPFELAAPASARLAPSLSRATPGRSTGRSEGGGAGRGDQSGPAGHAGSTAVPLDSRPDRPDRPADRYGGDGRGS